MAPAVVHHEECWAKTTEDGRPGISVHDHCLNVACVAEALLALLPLQIRQLLVPGIPTLAALHDVGKVSPGFQAKCEAWLLRRGLKDYALKEAWITRGSHNDHANIGQYTVQEVLRRLDLQLWAVVVGAHHGRIKGRRVWVDEPWEAERRRLADELIKEFGALPNEPPEDANLWLGAGLTTVADWIGSDERHFPQFTNWNLVERRSQAQSALAAIHWEPVQVKPQLQFSDYFPEIARPNSLQVTTMEVAREPGIYVIEAPMGSGKTEAALAAAYELIATNHASGLYFALPTQVTSNRIHIRVQPFLDRVFVRPASVKLVHSASWLFDSDPPARLSPALPNDPEAEDHVRSGISWFASAKRALLAPLGVGTVDQMLLGIVAAKHFFVRQFGMAGKVVILDEVHSYDLYTGTLIDKLIERLRELKCTVIILSATLTEKRRRELLKLSEAQAVSSAYPLVSGVHRSLVERACDRPPSNRIYIRRLYGDIPIEAVLGRASSDQCVLWIRNTVDDAQQTYRALQSARYEGGPPVALLHSRFPFFRREEVENEWMSRLGKDGINRPRGCILVSTQVAEQSVDIDADLLITDLAPTDMLLQRMGRLWRHPRPNRPCIRPEAWIQMPSLAQEGLQKASVQELKQALGKSARVYAPYVLLRSLEQWENRESITLPDEIRTVLEATYADPHHKEPAAWQELRRDIEQHKERMAQLALSATLIWTQPSLSDDEGIQTRYSTYPRAQLLLVGEIDRLEGGTVRLHFFDNPPITLSGHKWNFEAAKAIHRHLTPVPKWSVTAGLQTAPPWLRLHVSGPAAVGVVQNSGEIRWTDVESKTGLSYQPDQGVMIDGTVLTQLGPGDKDESYD